MRTLIRYRRPVHVKLYLLHLLVGVGNLVDGVITILSLGFAESDFGIIACEKSLLAGIRLRKRERGEK